MHLIPERTDGSNREFAPITGKPSRRQLMVQWCCNLSSRNRGPPGSTQLITCVVSTRAWGNQSWHANSHDQQLISIETVQESPQVSNAIKKPEGLKWLDAISQSNSVLSAILAVIHPELHGAGQKTFNQLREHSEIIDPQDMLCRWASAFNSVSVNFNHLTPAHQDGKSRRQWYDLLVTLGCYRNCNLELPGLGFRWSTALVQ